MFFLSADALRADDLHQISVAPWYGNPQSVHGAWTVHRVTVTNSSAQDAVGSIEVSAPGPHGTIDLRMPLVVPSHARTSRAIFLPPLSGAGTDGVKEPIFVWKIAGSQAAQGQSISHSSDPSDPAARRSTVLNLVDESFEENDINDFQVLCKTIAQVTRTSMVPCHGRLESASRHLAGYDSCRVIVLSRGTSQSLDVLQRRTLLDFVRGGGTLLISAPASDDWIGRGWLEPYMPVRLIGHRSASGINASMGPMRLKRSMELSEAVGGGGTAVISDEAYVHAGFRQLGLGRVAFTSFPVTAPSWDSTAAAPFWSNLLGLEAPDLSWSSTAFAGQQASTMGEMIGTPAPSRAGALALASGFVALMVACQLLWRGTGRPIAFAISSAVAVLGAVVLIVMALSAQGRRPLTAGRIAVAHLSDTGGFVQELAAFTGDDAELSLSTANPSLTLHPVAYDRSHPPVLSVSPFSAPGAGAASRRIDRIWESTGPAPASIAASASGEFDENGFTLSVDNRINSTLAHPVLVYRSSVFRLPTLDRGTSRVRVDAAARNAPPPPIEGDAGNAALNAEARRQQSLQFMNSGPVMSEMDRLRGQLLAALATRSSETSTGQGEAWIAGWTDEVPPLITPSASPAIVRSLSLATFPLTIRPSGAGAEVRIDAGFNTPLIGPAVVPVYDPWSGRWQTSSLPGSWAIGFRPPPQIGRVRLTRATLRASVTLPAHTMTLRRQQARGGKLLQNAEGAVIAEWSNTFGPRPVASLELSDDDVDRDGVFWLLMTVEATGSGTEAAPLWGISDLGVDFQGRVEPAD